MASDRPSGDHWYDTYVWFRGSVLVSVAATLQVVLVADQGLALFDPRVDNVYRAQGRGLPDDTRTDPYPHRLYIQIPLILEPEARYARFEAPLEARLEEEELGEVTNAGSMLRDGKTPCVSIEVEVEDANKGLALIRDVLSAAQAPPETVIRHEEAEFSLADAAGFNP